LVRKAFKFVGLFSRKKLHLFIDVNLHFKIFFLNTKYFSKVPTRNCDQPFNGNSDVDQTNAF